LRPNYILIFLKISAFSVLFGRAIKHIFWDAPFRIIFWDKKIMEPILDFFNSSFQSFVSSAQTDFWIQTSIQVFGFILLFISSIVLFIKKKNKKLSPFLLFGSALLILLSYLFYKAKFKAFGQFIEYSCQMFSPLFLYMYLFKDVKVKKHLLTGIKLAIALTFIGHGLYAVGYYKTPANFLNMTFNSFAAIGIELSNSQIYSFLKIVGILDFLIAISLFCPKNITRPLLIWAILWGFFTSLARLVSSMYLDFSFHTFSQWIPEFIFRIPHFMLPLCCYYILYKLDLENAVQLNIKPIYKSKNFKKVA